jgi:hypothetical protein
MVTEGLASGQLVLAKVDEHLEGLGKFAGNAECFLK